MSATSTFAVIFVLIFLWLLWYYILVRKDKKKLKKLLENYDEKEDLSKQGEEHGRELRGEIATSGRKKPDSIVDDGLGEQHIVPLPPTSSIRKTSISKRKTSNSPRGILGKLRRRN